MSPETMPNDPCLTQLVTSCDQRQMLGIFQRHLGPPAEEAVSYPGLHTIPYSLSASYKMCSAIYPEHEGADTGEVWEQWITGMIYPDDRSERIFQKIQSAGTEHGIHDYLITDEPAFYIPDLGMLVQVFPYDRRIPALPYLSGGPPSDLMHLIRERFGPGKWHMEDCNIKPVRYRAGLGEYCSIR